MTNSSSSGSNQRVLAALAHTCVIVPFWGIIGAIGIWVTQKNSSTFVGFQALQAILYQLMSILFGLCLGIYTFGITFFLLIPPTNQINAVDFSPLWILAPSFCGGLLILGYFGYGLWAAISVLRGRDFRYLIIGTQLEKRYLS